MAAADVIRSNVCFGLESVVGRVATLGRWRVGRDERRLPRPRVDLDASCLHLNVQPMNYQQASEYCHSMQSELFTFQNSDLEPIYTVTRGRRRRKRQGTIEQRTIAWTSAHASDFDDGSWASAIALTLFFISSWSVRMGGP